MTPSVTHFCMCVQTATDPLSDPDTLCETLQKQEDFNSEMKGGRAMHLGAFRTDKERMQKALEDQAFLDSKPTKPEHQNWNLRRRNRAQEIGPEFRFNSTLQVQRILDTLQHDIGSWYEIDEVNGKNSGFRNDKALKQFIKTGEHNFVPGVNPDDYDSDTELKAALKRDKKIH